MSIISKPLFIELFLGLLATEDLAAQDSFRG